MQNPELRTSAKAFERCTAGEQRANILGVGISAISMTDAVFYTDQLLQGESAAGYICVTGVHGVMEAQQDDGFRGTLNGSFLTTPDGMPMVWFGRIFGHRHMRRVSGPEYMIEVCRLSLRRGYKHFLYGGREGTAESLKAALEARFPGLQITGTYTPPFRPLTAGEEADLERRIRDSGADVLWCGISTPKQERFMERYCGRFPVKLMVGVGAAFDIHSGNTKDAPDWVKNVGLHWLVRMLRDPRRLAGRYLKNNPRFLWLIGLQLSGLRKFLLPRSVPEALSFDDAVSEKSPAA